MFLLMGYVSHRAGLTEGLFRAARLWFGRVPGGLAVTTVVGSAMFSAVTGSSVACAAAMARIALPEMLRHRYDAALATGAVAAAGTIGSLIPPSIILLIYGIFAEVPIGKLFLAGLILGLLTAAMYIAMIIVRVRLRPALAPATDARPQAGERLAALSDTWPVLLLIITVFGGLFGGLFTPTEAGAVGALLAILLGAGRRALRPAALRDAVAETLRSTAAIFIIAVGAALLTRFLALSGVPAFLTDNVAQAAASGLFLVLGFSLVYLVLGMFLDPIGIMLLTLPVLLPVAKASGLDLIWLGIVVTKYLEIGLITPPIGLNVFVIRSAAPDIATGTIFRGITWFVVADPDHRRPADRLPANLAVAARLARLTTERFGIDMIENFLSKQRLDRLRIVAHRVQLGLPFGEQRLQLFDDRRGGRDAVALARDVGDPRQIGGGEGVAIGEQRRRRLADLDILFRGVANDLGIEFEIGLGGADHRDRHRIEQRAALRRCQIAANSRCRSRSAPANGRCRGRAG